MIFHYPSIPCKWNRALLSFSVWLLSRDTIPSRFICLTGYVRISFLQGGIIFHAMDRPHLYVLSCIKNASSALFCNCCYNAVLNTPLPNTHSSFHFPAWGLVTSTSTPMYGFLYFPAIISICKSSLQPQPLSWTVNPYIPQHTESNPMM